MITPDVKQTYFMKEIKLRDVLASLEDFSMRLKNRLKGRQPSTPPTRQHQDHEDDDDTTIVTFHSLEESVHKRTTSSVTIATHNDDNAAADDAAFIDAFSSTTEVVSIIKPPVDKVPVATLIQVPLVKLHTKKRALRHRHS